MTPDKSDECVTSGHMTWASVKPGIVRIPKWIWPLVVYYHLSLSVPRQSKHSDYDGKISIQFIVNNTLLHKRETEIKCTTFIARDVFLLYR